MECSSDVNLKSCRCTYNSCPNKGKCCKCIRNHRDKGELPGCFFSPEGERTYDRSIANFLKYQR